MSPLHWNEGGRAGRAKNTGLPPLKYSVYLIYIPCRMSSFIVIVPEGPEEANSFLEEVGYDLPRRKRQEV